ncbi:hypothetical protein ACS8FD_07690 [Psychrobacter sp. 1U2]|uniref:hypothetical protein n=1 Tax=Psychrobacter sp. 1U2 TaxID=3453577 RepID=UPI003F4764F8
MKTNDPALTKTPISSHDAISEMVDGTHNATHADEPIDNHVRADGSTLVTDDVVDSTRVSDVRNRETVGHETASNTVRNHEKIEENTDVNKGTDTFEDEIVDSKHVNDGDNPARQPDRRDQQGSSPFDEGVNDQTVGSEEPKSKGLNDMNRYASIDNAQTRILNPDEKD